ncbi:MAG: calcium-binding protein [Candidatus Thiodiazotropha sp.]
MSLFSLLGHSLLGRHLRHRHHHHHHSVDMNSTTRTTDAKTGKTVLDARGGNDKINVHQNIDGSVTVRINDKETHQFTAEEARCLEIKGGDGNDSITMTGQQLYGMPNNITISGGKGNDKIYGGAGNQTLSGGEGNDIITGGAGNDRIFGGAGNDRIFGGSGGDYINGGAGNDSLYGQAGNDTIVGGGGYDYLVGGSGCDVGVGGREDYSVGIEKEIKPHPFFKKSVLNAISAR